jgi:LacI family transcriptional regulator/LacI family repressor for deo operon, udp, cdd, tsx, nupC, and nupG
MSRRSPSIEDIARAAGVANSTVSRALRDNPLISSDVRAHIQQLAREMGYTPNGIAQSLQNRRTNTIGLVVTSIADPFFGDVAKGVEQGAQAAGLSVVLSASHNDPAQEQAIIETFQRRRVDGIIVADSQISRNHAGPLARADVPTVLINSQAEQPSTMLHSVAVDDAYGAQLAAEHLLHLGHRKVGYLGVSNRPKSNRDRQEGFCNALSVAGAAPRPEQMVIAAAEERLNDDVATGQALLAPLLHADVTAVFCYNDMIAIGVLMACRDEGIRVPHELSVVGFDDIALAQYVTPPLTTIHQPKIELGRLAIETLLNLVDDRPAQNHVIRPTFVQRASTARLI